MILLLILQLAKRLFQRSLILEHLTCNGYIRTSQAFIQDMSPKHLDADGDEVIYALEAPIEKRDELTLQEEEVAFIMLRKGTSYLLFTFL
jgi:hypothetical protein